MRKKTISMIAAAVMLAVVGGMIVLRGDGTSEAVSVPELSGLTSDSNSDISTGQKRPSIADSESEKRILDVLERMCHDEYSALLSVPPDPNRVLLARENFKQAGVDRLVTIIEGDAHKNVTQLKGPIDILFIDADKSGYLDYLNKLLPLVRPGGLILAHNTTDVAERMQDYLDAVTTDPKLETIFLHEQASGIGVTLKKRRSE
jgi:hypothetical protein